MTAKELIEILQALDPETRIFTKGYEGGLEDADISTVEDIVLNVNRSWWYGPHDYLKRVEVNNKSNLTIVKGIIL
jgi:hypothetical protein